MGINVPQDIIAALSLKHAYRIVNRSRRGNLRRVVLRKMSSFGKFWRDRSRRVLFLEGFFGRFSFLFGGEI